METFLLIVKRNTFTVYKPERNYELQYINGEPSFPYEMNRVTDYLQNLFRISGVALSFVVMKVLRRF